jgi:hypothetical protein
MPIWQRVLLLPAIIAIFYADFTVESIGALAIVALLGLNWRKGRSGPGQAPEPADAGA